MSRRRTRNKLVKNISRKQRGGACYNLLEDGDGGGGSMPDLEQNFESGGGGGGGGGAGGNKDWEAEGLKQIAANNAAAFAQLTPEEQAARRSLNRVTAMLAPNSSLTNTEGNVEWAVADLKQKLQAFQLAGNNLKASEIERNKAMKDNPDKFSNLNKIYNEKSEAFQKARKEYYAADSAATIAKAQKAAANLKAIEGRTATLVSRQATAAVPPPVAVAPVRPPSAEILTLRAALAANRAKTDAEFKPKALPPPPPTAEVDHRVPERRTLAQLLGLVKGKKPLSSTPPYGKNREFYRKLPGGTRKQRGGKRNKKNKRRTKKNLRNK